MLEDPVASHCAEQRRECAQGGHVEPIPDLTAFSPLTHQHTWTILLAMDAPPDTLLP